MGRIEQKTVRGVLAGLTAVSSIIGLASHSFFLRRFEGTWGEGFCLDEVSAAHQTLIFTQFAIAFAAIAIVHLRRRVLAIGIPLRVFAIVESALQTWLNYRMSRWQWDSGCGVSYDWSPKRFVLQLFMTHYAGPAVVIVFAIALIAAIRAGLHDDAG